MIDQSLFVYDAKAIRERRPLVLSITNYVAMNITANALLAIGASPLMSFCPEEMDELVARCDALSINIGCLDQQQCEAMRIAVEAARRYNKPWVLDPVGVGASHLRNDICRQMVEINAPHVIRANASEVERLYKVLGMDITETGNDFSGLEAAEVTTKGVEAAQRLSQGWGSVVVISGAVDHIVHHQTHEQVPYGSTLMSQVTAMGCTASALVAAYCAVQSNALLAATHGMMRMGLAGEKAAQQASGPGTFVPYFLNCLAQ